MKNALKAFGLIALIAVCGFSMAACGGKSSSGIYDTWADKDGNTFTFRGSTGTIGNINKGSGWGAVLNTGWINNGQEVFRNIDRLTDSQWTATHYTYVGGTYTNLVWSRCTLTLSANKQTLTVYCQDISKKFDLTRKN